MTDPLTALVVGTDDWAAVQTAASLSAAGIEVAYCHEPGAPAFPCNAFIEGRGCPLDAGVDVVITARARPSRLPEPGEMGVVCGLRADRPLVVAGLTAHHPFASVAAEVVSDGGDAARACRAAAGVITRRGGDPTGGRDPVVDLRALRR